MNQKLSLISFIISITGRRCERERRSRIPVIEIIKDIRESF
jgi:hypothetical protein